MKFSFKKKNANATPHHTGFDFAQRITRDWTMVLGIFVLLVCAVAVADGYLLYKINRGDFFHADANATVSAETVKRKKLVDVVEYFGAREADYARLWATTTPRIDPSL